MIAENTQCAQDCCNESESTKPDFNKMVVDFYLARQVSLVDFAKDVWSKGYNTGYKVAAEEDYDVYRELESRKKQLDKENIELRLEIGYLKAKLNESWKVDVFFPTEAVQRLSKRVADLEGELNVVRGWSDTQAIMIEDLKKKLEAVRDVVN
jgi:hypothetical protein